MGGIGSLIGGAIGSAVLPGAGTAIGSKIGGAIGGKSGGKSGGGGSGSNAASSAMGLGLGLIQSIQARKQKNKAEASFPDLVDPSQAGYLAELGQKRKSIDTGADFAQGMQAIDATNAGTNSAIVQNSGGDSGGALQGLLQSERVAGDAKNNVIAQGQQQQMQYSQMYQGMLDQIAARKLQLKMQKSQQAKAEWAAKQKSASQNLMAGVSGLAGAIAPGVSGSQGQSGGVTPSTAAIPTAQQSTFGTVSSSPVIDKGIQQSTFGSNAGASINSDFLSNIRGGFKK